MFCTLLIALGFKIYYALDTHQPVMTGDYYEIGRDFDGYRRKQANAPDRRLESPVLVADAKPGGAALKRGVNLVPVEYRQVGGDVPGRAVAGAIAGARVSLTLSRRATVNEDISAGCMTDARGRCELRVLIPRGGYWEGRLQATEAGGETSFVRRRVFDVSE
ncbi:MAG: FixH family protein [Leptospirales bacterium]